MDLASVLRSAGKPSLLSPCVKFAICYMASGLGAEGRGGGEYLQHPSDYEWENCYSNFKKSPNCDLRYSTVRPIVGLLRIYTKQDMSRPVICPSQHCKTGDDISQFQLSGSVIYPTLSRPWHSLNPRETGSITSPVSERNSSEGNSLWEYQGERVVLVNSMGMS